MWMEYVRVNEILSLSVLCDSLRYLSIIEILGALFVLDYREKIATSLEGLLPFLGFEAKFKVVIAEAVDSKELR